MLVNESVIIFAFLFANKINLELLLKLESGSVLCFSKKRSTQVKGYFYVFTVIIYKSRKLLWLSLTKSFVYSTHSPDIPFNASHRIYSDGRKSDYFDYTFRLQYPSWSTFTLFFYKY